MKREIPALTGLRAIAAAWVFLFHVESSFATNAGPAAQEVMALLGRAGFLGVDIFFVLSGFVLALNYSGAGSHRSLAGYAEFLWKRLARVYPVHLVALLLLVLLIAVFALAGATFMSDARLTPGGLVRTLTLTHGWSVPITKTWNTVSWSISCEWAAYLAFPVLALAAARLRSALGIVAIIVALFAALAYVVHTGTGVSSMAFGMPRIAAEFTAGVLLCRLWELRQFAPSPRGGWLALGALAILIGGGNWLAAKINPYTAMFFMPIFACAVVYGVATGSGVVAKALSCRAAVFGGHLSYAFYMIHMLMLGVAIKVLIGLELTAHLPSIVAAVLAAFIVTTGLAAWIYRVIETPARRAMIEWRHRLRRPPQRELPEGGS